MAGTHKTAYGPSLRLPQAGRRRLEGPLRCLRRRHAQRGVVTTTVAPRCVATDQDGNRCLLDATHGNEGHVMAMAAASSPAAPHRGDRVVEAGAGRWFVHSDSVPGAWWHVQLDPGVSLTCSCPAGLRAGTNVNARPCRHKSAVLRAVAAKAA